MKQNMSAGPRVLLASQTNSVHVLFACQVSLQTREVAKWLVARITIMASSLWGRENFCGHCFVVNCLVAKEQLVGTGSLGIWIRSCFVVWRAHDKDFL